MSAPDCPAGHGTMVQRNPASQTSEQTWCGIWFDCRPGPHGDTCSSSALIPSDELLAFHESLKASQPTLDLGATR